MSHKNQSLFLSGGGGGGGGGSIADTIQTNDTVELILGLGEGEWLGPEEGAASLYFDQTPLVNADGYSNFEETFVTFFPGSPDGETIKPALGGFSSPITVSASLAKDIPVTRTGQQTNIDFIELRLIVQQLYKNNSDGAALTSATFLIEFKPTSSSTWQPAYVSTEPSPVVPTAPAGGTTNYVVAAKNPTGTAIGRYIQASEPPSPPTQAGVVWLDTDDNHKPYMWNGSIWTSDAVLSSGGDYWTYTSPLGSPSGQTSQKRAYISETNPTVGNPLVQVGDLWVDIENVVKGIFNGESFFSDDSYFFQDTSSPNGVVTIRAKITRSVVREFRFYVENITDTYDVRITQLSEDTDEKRISEVSFESFAEVIASPMTFPNTTCLQIVARASDQFSRMPTVQGIYKGRIVRVPSNYDPVERTYTGIWDGTWKLAWSDNPAYIFKDFAESERYGLSYIYPHNCNSWSIYRWGQYCDVMVPDGQGGSRPRWTFNHYQQQEISAKEFANFLAGVGAARYVDDGNGQIEIIWDDPNDQPVALFNNASVVDGSFEYSYTDRQTRPNLVVVSFKNRELFFRTDKRLVQDVEDQQAFGVIKEEFEARGCRTVSEALARARLRLVSGLTEKQFVSFKTNRKGRYIAPWSIILIADEDASYGIGGRILEKVDGNTVLLDAPVHLEAGVDYDITFDLLNPDYPASSSKPFITQTFRIVNGTGTHTEINVQGTLPALPAYAVYAIGAPNEIGLPKAYRVLSVEAEGSDPDRVSIRGVEVNRAKYQYIDGSTDLLPEDRSTEYWKGVVEPVSDLQAEIRTEFVGASPIRVIDLTWQKSASRFLSHYKILSSTNDDPLTALSTTREDYFQLRGAGLSKYTFAVVPVDITGVEGKGRTIDVIVAGSGRVVPPPVNLRLRGSGTSFSTKSPTFEWGASSEADPSFSHYLLQVLTQDGTTLVRQSNVGSALEWTYNYADHQQDTLRRSFKIRVAAVDTSGALSTWIEQTFTNPQLDQAQAPGLNADDSGIDISWAPPAADDYSATVVHASQTNGFTPDSTNRVWQGQGQRCRVPVPTTGLWYVRIGHTDSFNTSDMLWGPQASVAVKTVDDLFNEMVEAAEQSVAAVVADLDAYVFDADGRIAALGIDLDDYQTANDTAVGEARARADSAQDDLDGYRTANDTAVGEARTRADSALGRLETVEPIVQGQGSAITTLQTAQGLLAEDLSALTSEVEDPSTGLSSRASNLRVDAVETEVGGKADASALDQLAAVVNNPSTGLSTRASQSSLNTVATEVSGKASAASVEALRADYGASLGAQGSDLLENGTFEDWPDGQILPTGYGSLVGSNPTKETLNSRYGNYSLRMVSDTGNHYFRTVSNKRTVAKEVVRFYFEIEFTFNSGTLAGAGILFRKYKTSGHNEAYIKFADEIPSPVIGDTYVVTKILEVPVDEDYNGNVDVYSMNNWSTFGQGMFVKDITWHRVSVAPANTVANQLKQAQADIVSESAARVTADAAETSARQAAVSTLQGGLSDVEAAVLSEATTRAAADLAETTARQTAISALQTDISDVEAAVLSEASTRATEIAAETSAREIQNSKFVDTVTQLPQTDFPDELTWTASAAHTNDHFGLSDFLDNQIQADGSTLLTTTVAGGAVAGSKKYWPAKPDRVYEVTADIEVLTAPNPVNIQITSASYTNEGVLIPNPWWNVVQIASGGVGRNTYKAIFHAASKGSLGAGYYAWQNESAAKKLRFTAGIRDNIGGTAYTGKIWSITVRDITNDHAVKTSVEAAIVSEAFTRAAADLAETTARQAAVSSLQTDISDVEAGLVSEASTRATEIAAEADRRELLAVSVSGNSSSESVAKNPNFTTWNDSVGRPQGWDAYVDASAVTKDEVETYKGRPTSRHTVSVASTNTGMVMRSWDATHGIQANIKPTRYVRVTATVKLLSGGWDGAGFYLNWRSEAGSVATRLISFSTLKPNAPMGEWVTFVWEADYGSEPAAEVDRYMAYAMSNYPYGPPREVKTLLWASYDLEFIDTGNDSVSAKVFEAQNAIADLDLSKAEASTVSVLQSRVEIIEEANPNLLANGGFEAGNSGWTLSPNHIITKNNWGLQLQNFSNGTSASSCVISEGIYPGEKYTLSADLLFFANLGSAYCDILWLDANDVLLLDDTGPSHSGSFKDYGSRKATTLTAPPNTAKAVVRFVSEGLTDTSVTGVRRIKLEKGEVSTPYSDESYAETLNDRVTTAEADIVSEASTRAAADSAQASTASLIRASLKGKQRSGEDWIITADDPEAWGAYVSQDMNRDPGPADWPVMVLPIGAALQRSVKDYIPTRTITRVRPGETVSVGYRAMTTVQSTTGGTNYGMYVYMYDAGGVYIGSATLPVGVYNTSVNTLLEPEGDWTVPSTCHYIWPYIYVNIVTGQNATANVLAMWFKRSNRLANIEADASILESRVTTVETDKAEASEVSLLEANLRRQIGQSGGFSLSFDEGLTQWTESISGAPETITTANAPWSTYVATTHGPIAQAVPNGSYIYLLSKQVMRAARNKRVRLRVVARYIGSNALGANAVSLFFRTLNENYSYSGAAPGFKDFAFTTQWQWEEFVTEATVPTGHAYLRPGLYIRDTFAGTGAIEIAEMSVEEIGKAAEIEADASILEARVVTVELEKAEATTVDALDSKFGPNFSSVNTVSQALSELEGSAAFLQTIVAASGSNPAIMRLLAGKNGSQIDLISDVIRAANTGTGGQVIDVFRAVNGVLEVINKLTVGTGSNLIEIDPASGSIIITAGLVRMVLGTGFGVSSNLAFWFGLTRALNTMSTSNSIFHLTTAGDAYFGGNLSAGVLTNKSQSSGLGTTDETIVGPFGSNGSPIAVSFGAGYQRQYFVLGSTFVAPTVSSNPSISTSYYRKIGSGSETLLGNRVSSGGVDIAYNGYDEWEPNTFSHRWSVLLTAADSWTYTDNAGGSTDRTFRLNRTAINGGVIVPASGHTVYSPTLSHTRNLSIIATE